MKKIFCLGVMFLLVFVGNLFARPMSLDEAIRTAQDNSPELKLANIDLAIIRNSIYQSKTVVLPKIDFAMSHAQNNSFDDQLAWDGTKYVSRLVDVDTTRYDMRLSIEQKLVDLEFFEKSLALKYNYKSKQSSYNKVRSDIAFKVATAYYNLIKSELTGDILEEDIVFLDDYLQDLKTKVDVKFEDRQSLISTSITLENKKQDLYRNQREYYTLKTDFARLLMIPLTLDFKLGDVNELSKIVPVTINTTASDELFNKAKETRWDVKELLDTKQSLLKQTASVKARYLPSFDVYATYGYLNEDMYRVAAQDEYWTVNLRARFNIFNGFSDYLAVKESELKCKKVDEEISNLKQQIDSDLNASLYYLEVLSKMHTDALANMNLAWENYASAKDKFVVRESTKEDLLTAKLAYNNAKLQYVQTKVDLLLEQKKYEYIIGELK